MSFILKALKKIENDAAKKDLSRLTPQKADLFKTIEHQINRKRFINKRNAILIVLIFIVAGSVIFLKLKPQNISTVENTDTILPVTTLKTNRNQLSPLHTRQKKPETTQGLLPEPVLAKHAPVLKKKPNQVQINPLPVKNKTDVVTQAYEIDPAGKKNISAMGKHHEKTNGEDIQIKRELETGLKLQAIAWAHDPEKRLTVINGKVIHEGEYIDNAAVVQIDKNQIVFKENGKTWRQVFRSNPN